MLTRRAFTKRTSIVAFGLAAAPLVPGVRAAASPGETLRVAVLGMGRGSDHIRALQQIQNVEVAYIVDVDDARLAKGAKLFDTTPRRPKTAKDFRRVLDDKSVDALFIATPNHWHAPATIMACAAGKHVYVEKPGSHNAREGELMVEAARKHKRVVQMGAQRRSWPGLIEAVARLREGAIGKVLSARCWYSNARASIGRGKQVPVPEGLDFSMWQGPAPERPYIDNLVHYNWHWRWHWGGGELANNGIHALDVARWGLGVEVPLRVTCNGGRYHFNDDQETPDTTLATFHFGDRGIHFDGSICNPRGSDKLPFVEWYGESGTLANEGNGYKIYDAKGKVTGQGTGPAGEKGHIENFLDSVRGNARPNCEIAVGQTSTLLCHLGNIAYKTGGAVRADPETRRLRGNSEAETLWGREYRAGWEPKV